MNTLTGTINNDTINGNGLDDFINGGAGNDTISGGAGKDFLYGGAGDDTVSGGTGDDYINGGNGSNTLNGDEGNDTIYGGINNDIIIGGIGKDKMYGGDGNDTYRFAIGDGTDEIYDTSGTNKIVFTDLADTSTLNFYRYANSLIIQYGFNDSDRVTITNYFAGNTIETVNINGSDSNLSDIIHLKGVKITGTAGNDSLIGSSQNDYIIGLAGNDTISSLGGDDTLDGGFGNDSLQGGTGSDTYTFADNWGKDTIIDGADSETLRFTGNTRLTDLTFIKSNNDLIIVKDNNNQITVQNFYLSASNAIEAIEFTNDGSNNLDFNGILSQVTLNGTTGVDTINGSIYGDNIMADAGNDILYGLGGIDTLFGDDGNDKVYGGDGDDVIYGGAGDDLALSGDAGDDLIYGNEGNDTIYGGLGTDILIGELGNDTIYGDAGDDIIDSGDDNDTVYGGDGSDFVIGGLGDDSIKGDTGNDLLEGNEGNDTIYGGIGDDTIFGGSGNDTLYGETGNDTFVFETGSGTDTVIDASGNDLIVINDAFKEDLSFSASGSDLIISFNENDSIIYKNYLQQTSSTTQVQLADGNTYSLSSCINELNIPITGTNNAETLNGTSYNDVIDGKIGPDTLIGGAGNDAYVFSYGYGKDTIDDAAGSDTIRFETGITADKLSFGKSGANLIISIIQDADGNPVTEITDQVIIKNYFLSDSTKIENVLFSGSDTPTSLGTLIPGSLAVVGTAYADTIDLRTSTENLQIKALGGNDTIFTGSGADTVYGGSGNDTITAGTGNDTLYGEGGDDSYVFNFTTGSGADTIIESAGTDTINLTATGKLATDLRYSKQGNDLVISVNGINTSSVSIKDYFVNDTSKVETLIFNGISLGNLASLWANKLTLTGTSGNDTLTGTDYNDTLAGNIGNDTLSGGAGSDTLSGGDGDDNLLGEAGNDSLQGGSGNDTYSFGDNWGKDTVIEAGGTDTIRFTGTTTLANLTFTKSGNDLLITKNASNQIIVSGFYLNLANTLESIQFDNDADNNLADFNAIINQTAIVGTESIDNILGSAYDDIIRARGGNDTIDGSVGSDTIYGGSGNDTIIGGVGNDTLYGEADNDTYVFDFAANSGNDSIIESAGTDTINIKATGKTSADFRYTKQGNDLIIELNGISSSSVTISNYFSTDANKVETLMLNSVAVGALSSLINNKLAIAGSDSDDTLVGSDLNDIISGYAGNDALDGGAGNDALYGGTGDDTLYGSTGHDVIRGEAGNDTIDGGQGDDYINGGTGDDTLYGSTGNDIICDEAGNDTIDGGAGNDMLIGGAGQNTYLFGSGSGIDTISVANATDIVKINTTVDQIHVQKSGTGFNDLTVGIRGTQDQFTITGFFASGATLKENMTFQLLVDGEYQTYDYNGICAALNLTEGTGNNDTIEGNVDSNNINAYGGNDLITGGDGNDLISGGDGDDMMVGNAGNDTLIGGQGDDLLVGNRTDTADDLDTLIGGVGNDTYAVYQTNTVVTENADWGKDMVISGVSYTLGANVEYLALTGLDAPFADINTLLDLENLSQAGIETVLNTLITSHNNINGTGNSLDNIIIGNNGDNVLAGLGGNDTLGSGDGNDRLDGGSGSDHMSGGYGDDTYVVDNSLDIVDETYSDGNDTVESYITYTLGTNVENLKLMGTNSINATGNSDNNEITGNSNANTIDGGLGNDTIDGGAGNDTLKGNAGNDTYLFADSWGRDVISETSGTDKIRFTGTTQLSELTFSKVGNDLVIIKDNDNQITVQNFYASSSTYQIEAIEFDNDPTSNLSNVNAILALTKVLGTEGNDAFTSTRFNETLVGKGGNDTYNYDCTTANGVDTIIDTSGTDTLNFKIATTTITGTTIANTFRFFKDGDNLVIKSSNLQALVTVNGYFASEANRIETLALNGVSQGSLATADGFEQWGTASTDTIYGTSFRDELYGYGGNDTLYGYDGNDHLQCYDGNDTLYGGAGDDYLYADLNIVGNPGGDDTLVGGTGNDRLEGFGGTNRYIFSAGDGNDMIVSRTVNDTIVLNGISAENVTLEKTSNGLIFVKYTNTDSINIGASTNLNIQIGDGPVQRISDLISSKGLNIYGTAAADSLTGTALNEVIWGRAGNDTINGGDGNDTLYGEAGIDSLSGNSGNDTLDGGADADTLDGGLGDDTLKGGTGNDTLKGSTGNDTYVFNLGDGADTLTEADGTDTISFGASINRENLSLERSANDLIIKYSANDNITVKNYFYSDAGKIETIRFNDSSTINLSQYIVGTAVNDTSLTGTISSDTILGNGGNDTLTGNKGNDVLMGGIGEDTYVFNLGDGVDTITEAGGTTDTIKFGAGITQVNISAERSENDLIISYSENDSITIKNYYANANNKIESIKFNDNSTMNLSGYVIGTAGNDTLTGTTGNDTIVGNAGNDTLNGDLGNDTLIGNDGNDTISGGKGNDTLIGSFGDDTYLFNLGNGQDLIQDLKDTNKIIFGSGISSSQLKFENVNDNLVITIDGYPNDKLTVEGWYSDPEKVGTIEFQSGDPSISASQILNPGEINPLADNNPANRYEYVIRNEVIDDGQQLNFISRKYEYNQEGQLISEYFYPDSWDTNLNKPVYGDTYEKTVYTYNQDGSLASKTEYTYSKSGRKLEEEGAVVMELHTSLAQPYDKITTTIDATNIEYSLGGTPTSYQKFVKENDNLARILDGNNNDTEIGHVDVQYSLNNGHIEVSYFIHIDGMGIVESYKETMDSQGRTLTNYEYEGDFRDSENSYLSFVEESTYDESGKVLTTRMAEYYDNGMPKWDETKTYEYINGVKVGYTNNYNCHYSISNEYSTNNTYTAKAFDNIITGTNSADTINAGASTSNTVTIIAGKGNDTITGSSYDDVYSFQKGDGQDTVTDASGADTIVFGTGINASNLTFDRVNNDLVINYSETDKITIKNNFVGTSNRIETIKFADGSTMTPYVLGTTGDDTLTGSAGNDRIEGKQGSDSLQGYTGNDTYVFDFDQSSGLDSISEFSGNDRISIKATGKTASDLNFTRVQDNLVIRIDGITESVIAINNFFVTSENSEAEAKIESLTLNDTDLGSIESLMASGITLYGTGSDDTINATTEVTTIYGFDGNDTIVASTSSTQIYGGEGNDSIIGNVGNDKLYGENGADLLKGSIGDDSLTGGEGNDTYVFNLGDGNDTVIDTLGTDTITFSAGIIPADLSFERVANDFIIKYSNNDHITIKNYYTSSHSKIENLSFTGAPPVRLDSYVVGTSGPDTLESTNLNETMLGSIGDDTYVFSAGSGSDTITEMTGNDTIQFNAGIIKESVSYERMNNDMVIRYGINDYITIKNQFLSPSSMVETARFADFSTVSLNSLVAGTAGDDGHLTETVTGSTFYGGTGNDAFDGGTGDNTYLFDFNKNSGNDTIVEHGGTDTISIRAVSKTLTDLTFARNDYNLVIGIDGMPESITLANYFQNESAKTEQLILNGISLGSIDGLMANKTISVTGTENTDTISGTTYSDIITAGAGNDVIAGNTGNDILNGDEGEDTYVFNAGDGKDTITDTTGSNKIQFGADIAASDLVFKKANGNRDLVISFKNNPNDSITIKDQFAVSSQLNDSLLSGKGVQSIEFQNGDATIGINNVLTQITFDPLAIQEEELRYSYTLMNSSFIKDQTAYNSNGHVVSEIKYYNINWNGSELVYQDSYEKTDYQYDNEGNLVYSQEKRYDLEDNLLEIYNEKAETFNVLGKDYTVMVDAGGQELMDDGTIETWYTVKKSNTLLEAYSDPANQTEETLVGRIELSYQTQGDKVVVISKEYEKDDTGNFELDGSNVATYDAQGRRIEGYEYDDDIISNPDQTPESYSKLTYDQSTGKLLTRESASDYGNWHQVWTYKYVDDVQIGYMCEYEGVDGQGDSIQGTEYYFKSDVFQPYVNWQTPNFYTGHADRSDILTGSSSADTIDDSLDTGHSNIFIGGYWNDTLKGGSGNDTYYFKGNDSWYITADQDVIYDAGGNDKVFFDESIEQSGISLFYNAETKDLTVGYTSNIGETYESTSYITVKDYDNNAAASSHTIEKIQLQDGKYIDNADINLILQQMASYDSAHAEISLTDINSVKNNTEIMTIINNQWHS